MAGAAPRDGAGSREENPGTAGARAAAPESAVVAHAVPEGSEPRLRGALGRRRRRFPLYAPGPASPHEASLAPRTAPGPPDPTTPGARALHALFM